MLGHLPPRLLRHAPGSGPGEVAAFNRALIGWYEASGRRLAFRETADPYAILVSEVMLQQTQIARIEQAWRAFLDRFPTIEALAAAAPADVLRAWTGLGYNRRAVHLQRAARIVVTEHGGRLPGCVEDLERLPGVGPYTARAVAAIAFGVPVAAVDTNVRRVLNRVHGGAGAPGDPGTPMAHRELQVLADRLVDRARPAAWTHAVMDLGSAICRRRRPECGACPLRPWCGYVRARAEAAAGPAGMSAPSPREARAPGVPFERTNRWLRGRIVEALRDADPGAWVTLPAGLGVHRADAVEKAAAALERDRVIERDGSGRARLPIA